MQFNLSVFLLMSLLFYSSPLEKKPESPWSQKKDTIERKYDLNTQCLDRAKLNSALSDKALDGIISKSMNDLIFSAIDARRQLDGKPWCDEPKAPMPGKPA